MGNKKRLALLREVIFNKFGQISFKSKFLTKLFFGRYRYIKD